MPAPFIMPIPKIGNHPEGCPCNVCRNARKRLANSPYVQQLQRLVLQYHGEWQEALGAGLSITQDLHAEGKELAWAEDNLTSICSVADKRAVLLEKASTRHDDLASEFNDLLKVRDALKTELAGYAAELKTITTEANLQRKTADDATAALKLAKKRTDNLEAENARLLTALKQAGTDIEQERSAGWVETRVVGVVTAVIVGLAFYLIGRHGR